MRKQEACTPKHLPSREGPRLATHADTLSAMDDLEMAKPELRKDELHSACEMLTSFLDERRRKLGKENLYTLWSICNLTRAKSALRHTMEAELEMRSGSLIAVRNLGDIGWTNLAQVLVRQKRYAEAGGIFLDVIDWSKFQAGAREEGEHSDQTITMWYAVECYRLQGKYEEAKQMCEDVLRFVGQHRRRSASFRAATTGQAGGAAPGR